MSSQPYKVFVVNLKKDTDRRACIEKHFADRCIKFEFVDDISGQDIN